MVNPFSKEQLQMAADRAEHYLVHKFSSAKIEDIRDSVNNILLKYIEKPESVNVSNSDELVRWFKVCAYNNMLDRIKYNDTKNFVNYEDESNIIDAEYTMDKALIVDEEKQIIDKMTIESLITQLRDDYRQIIQLHDLEKWKFKEIAEIMDISYEYAKKLHQRAFRKLKDIANESNIPPDE